MRFIGQSGFFLCAVLLLFVKNGHTQDTTTVNIAPYRKCYDDSGGGSFHDFESMDLHERETIPLSRYTGKVLLVVNVASF
ncbi:hypothetical protein WDU94_006762 [Cyamophila willieti]